MPVRPAQVDFLVLHTFFSKIVLQVQKKVKKKENVKTNAFFRVSRQFFHEGLSEFLKKLRKFWKLNFLEFVQKSVGDSNRPKLDLDWP